MPNKPQEYRWIIIDKRIREGKFPNTRTLSEELEVSRKTIQRDINYLKYMKDAPIDYDKNRKGYYYTEEYYRLPSLSLSEGDLFALAIAEKVLAQYKNTPLYDRFKRVYESIRNSNTERVTINPEWIDSNITIFLSELAYFDQKVWSDISLALRDNKIIVFRYTLPLNERRIGCKVEPYHLLSYRGEWYLIGYNVELEDFRTYALSRIDRLRITDENFKRRDFKLSKHFNYNFGIFDSKERYVVKLEFVPELANFILERNWHPSQIVKKREDGCVELTLKVNNLIEIKRWILSWGCGVRVLEPDILIKEIRAEIKKMKSLYPEDEDLVD